jgi:hypothetical protein
MPFHLLAWEPLMRVGPRAVVLVMSLLLAACGGDSGTEPPPPPPPGGDEPTLAQVTLDATPESLLVGKTLQLRASATSSDGDPMTNVTFAWASSNIAKATVNSTGLVTAVDTGSLRITVSSSSHSDTASFTLAFVPVASITLSPGGDTVLTGEHTTVLATAQGGSGQTLTDRDFPFTFSSSDESVAQVDAGGTVTAVAPGSVTITASYEAFSASANLLVPSCTTKVTVAENAWSAPIVFGGIAPGVSLTLPGTTWSLTGVLYAAGLVVGTDAGTTVIGQPATSYLASAAALPQGEVCVMNNAMWTGNSRTFARLTLGAGGGGVPGLRITQETFADPGHDDVLILRYTFRNTTASQISGLRVGMFADWDVSFDGDATDDVLRKTPTADASEALEADNATYPAIVGIRAIGTGSFSYLGWPQPDDATNADYYAILAGGASSATVSGDVRHLLGRGPFTLAPGGEVKVSFALAGGANRAAFTSALTDAATFSSVLAGQ